MPVKIFICYAHQDESLLKKLKSHLRPLQLEGLIDIWHDRDISAGTEWEREISEQLNSAQIILLLISPDFMNSDYCYGVEMQRALERHEQKEAIVIPVLLRPIYWQGTPLGKLQALPTDAKPVKLWPNQDNAFFNVAEGIRDIVETIISEIAEQWNDKALAYLRDKSYDEALSAFEQAFELDPNNLGAKDGIKLIKAVKGLNQLAKIVEDEELEQLYQAFGL